MWKQNEKIERLSIQFSCFHTCLLFEDVKEMIAKRKNKTIKLQD